MAATVVAAFGEEARSPRRTNKVILYPRAGDSIEQLKQHGIQRVENYGSYWLLEATDEQLGALKKIHGERLVRANYLNTIELATAAIDTTVGEPAIPAELRERQPGEKRLRLVQFVGPVLPEWVEQLRAAGKVISYIPNNAYLVWLGPKAEQKLQALLDPSGPIQWIGPYHPYYKIRKDLLAVEVAMGGETVPVRVAVVDGPQAGQTLDAIRRYSVGIAAEPYVQLQQRIIQLTVRAADIPQIAQLPDVLWIEKVVPKGIKDERQDLILASRTNQLPGHAPVPGDDYLDFLTNVVGGGLPAFTNSATYPIVDIADTGYDTTFAVHPDFYELGDRRRPSRVAYAQSAEDFDSGCKKLNENFSGFEDFCGHGTFVGSIVGGYSTRASLDCGFPEPVRARDRSGFQLGMGVSPFGRLGFTRIFSQAVDFITPCNPVPDCSPPEFEFCLESLVALAQSAYLNRARIQNNSWGEVLDNEGRNAGLYTADSQTFDVAVRDALLTGSSNTPGPSPLNQEFIVVFAGGNAGSVGNVGGFGDVLVTAPATAKNIIAVGATENVRLDGSGCMLNLDQDESFDISGFSSFGPCEDGRFKPEIVAPGSSIYGAQTQLALTPDPFCKPTPKFPTFVCADTNTGELIELVTPALYTCGAGTSFAAPAVSGGIQLLWWYFQNRLTNEFGQTLLQPSPAMAKAYLCNSARYLPIASRTVPAELDTLPSIAQGMGMMDLARMFDGVPRVIRDQSAPRALEVALYRTNIVAQQTYFSRSGQTYELSGRVASNGLPFRVTLAWTDAPGSPASFRQLVNDLDLEVTVNGQTYKGNVFRFDRSVAGGVRDDINNMESVFLPPGSTGTWTVVVRATNIAGDGVPNVGGGIDQDFALVVYNANTNSTVLSDVPNPNTNDTCQTASVLSTNLFASTNLVTVSVNLTDTLYHNVHPSPSIARGGVEAFWKIPAPPIGTLFIVDTFGSGFDTLLSVWRGECGSLEQIAANDNTGASLQSQVTFVVRTNFDHFVIVEGRTNATGPVVLNIRKADPELSIEPAGLDFGEQQVGCASQPRVVRLTNIGVSPVLISQIALAGDNPDDFSFSESCTGRQLLPGFSCTIEVTFTTTAVVTRNAILRIVSTDPTSPHEVPLRGEGITARGGISVSPTSLDFGSQNIGSSTNRVNVVRSTDCAPLNITAVELTGANPGDFSVRGNCLGAELARGSVCTNVVTFSPTAPGARSAILRIISNAANAPTNDVLLSGTGVGAAAVASLSPTNLSFGVQMVGTSSAVLTVTLSNTGTLPLQVGAVSINGAASSQFFISTNGCAGATLAPAASCQIGVRFAPTTVGEKTAQLVVNHNASGSPATATLTGTAIAPGPLVCLNPASLSFFAGAGLTSAVQSVTVSNCGFADLVITNVTVSGANSNQFLMATNTCGALSTFAPGQACTVGLRFFAPTGGTYSASLLIHNNAVGSPHTVRLSGSTICPPVSILPSVLPAAAVGQPYSQTLSISGGTPPAQFLFGAGTLPPGLTLTSAGLISGTPTTKGVFDFRVDARDSANCLAERWYTLSVTCPTITLLPDVLPVGKMGEPYSQQLTATGGSPPYVFAQTGGSLPAGLTVSTNGLISGTPTSPSSSFTVTATDTNGCTGSATYTLLLDDPALPGSLTVWPESLPNGVVGQPYTRTISATGGTAPYSYAVNSGALPPGFSLTAAGMLSGTPTSAGEYRFGITAADAAGHTGSREYLIIVSPAGCPAQAILPTSLPAAVAGQAYGQTLSVSGATAPVEFALGAGALPAGMALSAGGALSGVASAAGLFEFRVDSRDAAGCAAQRWYSLQVNCPELSVQPRTLPAARKGEPYSVTLAASGGVAGYAFALSAGALPAGLTLSSDGVLSGTPTATGGSFEVRVTDATGCAASRSYTLTVEEAASGGSLIVSPTGLANAVVGEPYSRSISATGGTAPYSFAVTAGSLPLGLSLTAAGTLSGTPIAAGEYNFTIRATDATAKTGSRNYSIVVGASANVSVSKHVSVNPAKPGDPLSYTIAVNNLGPSPATAVRVTDALPAAVEFVSASSGCAVSNGTVTCELGNLGAGSQASVSIVVVARAPGQVVNSVVVNANETDPDTANNAATATASVSPPYTVAADPAAIVDQDGDVVSVALQGPGSLEVRLSGNGVGPIAEIVLSGTDASSRLTIKVKRSGRGDGVVQIGAISSSGSLKAIDAPAAVLSGAGIEVAGQLGVVRLNAVQASRLKAAGIGSVRVGRLTGSLVAAGFTPANEANPMAGGVFAPGGFIGAVKAQSFADSVIAAARIGKVGLRAVDTHNGGKAFGVLFGDSLGAVSVASPPMKWNAAGPQEQALGDFHVKR